jgi:hypothetical protein
MEFKNIKKNDIKHIEKDISRINGILIITDSVVVAVLGLVLGLYLKH